MGKKVIMVLLVGLALASFRLADAQQPKKIAKIAYLAPSTTEAAAHLVAAFRQGLQELGYVEGKTFVLELRYGEARVDRLPEIARELVGLKVDVIVTATDPATAAVKRETQTIPIVMANSSDPVGSGFVASLARPGGNLTGLTSISAELSGKRLELVKEIFPKAGRVNVLWNPANSSNVLEFKSMEAAARGLSLKLRSLEARAPQDFQAAFAAATRERASALVLLRDPLIDSEHFQILDFAIDKRLPLVHGESQFVEAGGLMSYGPSRVELFRRAASYV